MKQLSAAVLPDFSQFVFRDVYVIIFSQCHIVMDDLKIDDEWRLKPVGVFKYLVVCHFTPQRQYYLLVASKAICL